MFDSEKFYDKLMDTSSIQDIPMTYIFRVAFVVFEIINSGECYRKEEY